MHTLYKTLSFTPPYKSCLTAWLFYSLYTARCPAGKFSVDGLGPLCRVCPKNSYQNQTGKTACKNCEHGTKTLQLAATSVEACGGNVTICQARRYTCIVTDIAATCPNTDVNGSYRFYF